MPVEAIANELWIGRLPDHFGTISRTDENVISLAQPGIYLTSIIGNSERKTVKSHTYVMKQSKPVLRHIPAAVGDTIRVSIVGAMTPEETAGQKKRYAVQPIAFELLDWLEIHHRGYKEHTEYINEERVLPANDNVFVDRTVGGDFPANEKLVRLMDHTTYNSGCSETREESIAHLVFSPNADQVVSAPDTDHVAAPHGPRSQDYAVFKSTNLSKARKLEGIDLYFPTLFPFGYGGPNVERNAHLSVARWGKRCMKLHGGAFPRHWGFVAWLYDYIALEKSFSQQYLSMRVRSSAVADGKWTKDDVHACYNHSRQMEECLRRGLDLPVQPPIVKRLMDVKKLVMPGLRAYAGSDESRSAGLHRAFGIQKRLGSANFFTTISPATSRSWVVAINCDLVNGEHCQLKFELGGNDMVLPNAAERSLAAGRNPYESAVYARGVLDVFLEEFLGWDFKYRAPKPGGGMLGAARWINTSVETQKQGDVHFHIVASAYGLPRTSAEFRAKLKDPLWADRFLQFRDGLLSTNPPLTCVVLRVSQEIVDDLDPLVLSQYDVSSFDQRLAGLFLSPFGFYHRDGSLHFPVKLDAGDLVYEPQPGVFAPAPRDDLLVAMCPDCWDCIKDCLPTAFESDDELSESKSSTSTKMPVEAIANELWIGRLPDHFGTISRTDENVISLAQPGIYLTSIIGNSERKTVKSHTYVMKQSKPVLRHIPAAVGDTIRVSIVGAMTPEETAGQKKRYAVQPIAFELLDWLEIHHRGYKEHTEYINEERVLPANDNVFVDRTVGGDFPANEKLVRLMDHTTYNSGCSETREESIAHLVFSPNADQVVSAPDTDHVAAPHGPRSQDYAVFKSTNLSKARKLEGIDLYFPTLFPFGYGGPNVERNAHLSVARWGKRCMKLHGGAFPRHWGFVAWLYDYIALEKSFSQQYLSMRVRSSAVADGKWTKDDVHACYNHSHQMEECLRRGLDLPVQPPVVKRLMDVKKLVMPGLRAYAGSDESRSAGLHRAFGIQKRLGSANFFTTISPATSLSWVVATNCDLVNGEHCQLKFELGGNDMVLPNAAERSLAAGRNPYQSAVYARGVLDVFLEEFLGWDFKYRAPKPGGGMLGAARWINTSVETQKQGDVHFHIAASAYGLPRTSAEFRAKLKDPLWADR
ncbi:hypothetical protein HDU98_003690 [Podochytrium sp. JEL0797]|nr:hypothetical protein HDU98_003690 [Podochytrium sp. JEL0797]